MWSARIWLTLQFVGMLMVLSMASSVRTVVVLGPRDLPPIPSVVKSVLQSTKVDGALLAPAQIDALCLDPDGRFAYEPPLFRAKAPGILENR